MYEFVTATLSSGRHWRDRRGSVASSLRSGMTLLELLLVLALIVMIGAMVLPALRGPFANYRLRKAGDLVRVQWTKARVRAMKTGEIQMFQFVPGQREFSIEPYYTQQDYLEADLEHSQPNQTDRGTGAVPGMSPLNHPPGIQTDQNRQLPEGVVFVSGMVKSDTRAVQLDQDTQDTPAMGIGGVEPILFYPDGTTSDAVVSLSNEQQLYVRVTLRGLTGTVKVSPLLSAEEWQQIEQALETANALQ